MPNIAKYDWEKECLEYDAEKAKLKVQGLKLSEMAWCEKRPYSYTLFSEHYCAFKVKKNNALTARILSNNNIKAANVFSRAMALIEEKPELAVNAAAKNLQFGGFAPQAMQMNVQQNNQNALIIPPLFDSEAQEAVKQLTGFKDE